MSIGDNIRNIRKQKGLTQAELGKRLDYTQQTIALYESSGDSLHVATVKKVAAALHVDVTELLTNTDNTVSPFYRYLASIGYLFYNNYTLKNKVFSFRRCLAAERIFIRLQTENCKVPRKNRSLR